MREGYEGWNWYKLTIQVDKGWLGTELRSVDVIAVSMEAAAEQVDMQIEYPITILGCYYNGTGTEYYQQLQKITRKRRKGGEGKGKG